MKTASARPLLVFAMQEESQDMFRGHDVLYTGIGKVNAAFALTGRLARETPSVVINLGTAGSLRHGAGRVVNPVSFVQRDMDVTALGFAPYQTPFSADPVRLETGLRAGDLPGGVCGTGDRFDISGAAAEFDAIDMEAYALALICARMGVSFLCLKYISDGADGQAHADWAASLHHAALALKDALKGAGYDDV